MANNGIMIPTYLQPVCSAGQVSAIIAKPRTTITGWMSRYTWLDIPPGKQGTARLFAPAEIGKLIALRLSISAGNMADTLGDSMDLVEPEIEAEYDRLTGQQQLDEWANSGTIEPRLPQFTEGNLLLVSRGGGGSEHGGLMPNDFLPTRSARNSGSYIADLAGFELPETTLPLGQGLRNGWTRMLWLLNGCSLAD